METFDRNLLKVFGIAMLTILGVVSYHHLVTIGWYTGAWQSMLQGEPAGFFALAIVTLPLIGFGGMARSILRWKG